MRHINSLPLPIHYYSFHLIDQVVDNLFLVSDFPTDAAQFLFTPNPLLSIKTHYGAKGFNGTNSKFSNNLIVAPKQDRFVIKSVPVIQIKPSLKSIPTPSALKQVTCAHSV